MKGIVPLFLLFFSLLFSCSDSTSVNYNLGAYYVEIATAQGEHVFLLDTGNSVRNVGRKNEGTFATGDRVYLVFSYVDGKTGEIEIHSSAKIFQKDLNVVRREDISNYANDPVVFESAWIGGHYLNLRIYMEYKSEAHKVFLIMDESQVNSGEIKLYFRHDVNNDAPGYLSPVYISCNLGKALGEPRGEQTLLINFNTTNYGDKTYKFKY
jgi:hypothetical protein